RAVGVDSAGGWAYVNDNKKALIVYSLAGVKQLEFPLPEIDGQTGFEFIVSPMGRDFLIRTATSVVHVKVKAQGGPQAQGKEEAPKVDPKIEPKKDNLVSIVTKSAQAGDFILSDLSLYSKNPFENARSTVPCWD